VSKRKQQNVSQERDSGPRDGRARDGRARDHRQADVNVEAIISEQLKSLTDKAEAHPRITEFYGRERGRVAGMGDFEAKHDLNVTRIAWVALRDVEIDGQAPHATKLKAAIKKAAKPLAETDEAVKSTVVALSKRMAATRGHKTAVAVKADA